MLNFDGSTLFFRDHEKKQNKLLLQSIISFLILIPVVAIPKIFGKDLMLFEELHWNLFIEILIVYILGYFSAAILFKFRPYSRLVKYIILIMIEANIFLISINPAVDLFISFALVPLISCLYVNKRFSRNVLIICYCLMIVSLIYRAFYVVPNFNRPPSSIKWLIAHLVGMTIEYIFSALVISIVIIRYGKSIKLDYQAFTKAVKTQNTITKAYVAMLSQKSPGIEEHLQRSSEYVGIITERLKDNKKYENHINEETLYCMTTCALLHNIGIISIPDEILKRKDSLNEEEENILKNHTVLGEKLIRENLGIIKSTYLQVACEMALYHHENWDGSGYPKGLSQEEIPLSARIMAGANRVDHLLSNFNEKQDCEFSQVMQNIKNMSGKELDPDIVDAILKSENEIYRVCKNM
ncbi:MAG: HD domain-containing protein [Treponema sp.]|nr:HD domain-containing protein [Treponema sp.]